MDLSQEVATILPSFQPAIDPAGFEQSFEDGD
jgi:hypothetical protein